MPAYNAFTFHYGWIKNVNIPYGTVVEEQFTFHYGWIKNLAELCSACIRIRFTFHYGWIKNGDYAGLYTAEEVHLHSTMDGLKIIKALSRASSAILIYIPLWMD